MSRFLTGALVLLALTATAQADTVEYLHTDDLVFDEYFGAFKWIDDHSVALMSRNGEKRFVVTFPPKSRPV